ncbi:anaerobic ribonucleoside-triphosphate reductase activating protein [Algoriphagus sp. CAU 1675]|uniref:anaerobic ribonucleoside-triphosphate reductase activating protein n=1 Tax=Algoriphagus sp. CAU 1675 TaxID=3032597 RepID=UPI0023DCA6BD|nr:anaerobic ribonucleoside-triphosphate reductase activating protein [Algoriphagus sp. CAU 1675]MDF2156507.1 anaerobic ribonucleoside-triphosphate reductase activating protein [Algoriphagus sp. CAU 1675]
MNTSNVHTSPSSLEKGRPVFSISPFTLLDFPDRTACILWFAGCNMRCGYCYNPEIVRGKGKLSWSAVLDFLLSRRRLLDGVVFSGGECTIHPQAIPFVREVKKMGFEVKIDTNGSRPKVIRQLIDENLLDYVALDFKALPEKYWQVTRSDLFLPFEKTLEILLSSGIRFEVRTTVHSDQLAASDLQKMENWLRAKGYSGTYYLQHFRGDKQILGELGESKKQGLKTESAVWRN